MKFTTLATCTCLAISASAFDYPEFVPLHRRQSPGTPEYDCHANCGGVIVSARSDDFCDSSKFKTELSGCLKCANEFGIWKYYGDSVSKAAKSCGLDATPEDADDEDNSTATQNAATTSAESSTFTSKTSAQVSTTSAEAEETSSALDITSLSATESFTTTASAAGSSHPVVRTGSTTASGSSTPASHTASASPSSSDTPLFNSASSIYGNVWISIAAGSFIAAVLGN